MDYSHYHNRGHVSYQVLRGIYSFSCNCRVFLRDIFPKNIAIALFRLVFIECHLFKAQCGLAF